MSTVLRAQGETEGLLTNLMCQPFSGSETWLRCLHPTKKLQCKRAQVPARPPLCWDLRFCTTNTTGLLIHSSLRVHMSIETPHKAALFCSSTLQGGGGTVWVRDGKRKRRLPPSSPVLLSSNTAATELEHPQPCRIKEEMGKAKAGKVDNTEQKTRPTAWYHNSSI